MSARRARNPFIDDEAEEHDSDSEGELLLTVLV